MSAVANVRKHSRRVAERASHVQIREHEIPLYAATLPDASSGRPPLIKDRDEREIAAAFWLTLDAINFGSGWFPTLRKLPGRTGYATIAAGVRRRFDARGPWTAQELSEITRWELARTLRQDAGHELVGLFAESLRDLGTHLRDEHGGSFSALVDRADGSAVALVELLAGWSAFADSSVYDGDEVPFLKRAQIAAADLSRAGVVRFDDLDQLTMFADNLVPHVLRLDGIITFEEDLIARIGREELIEHGSPEEVEIRACAVHAVELIVSASPTPTTAARVDQILWHRGQGRGYKAVPRHRSRSTAY
jgi:hypothetical protein